VVTLEPTDYLEINASALDLSSEEVVDRFRKVLLATVFDRFQTLNKTVAKYAEPAVEGTGGAIGDPVLELKIEPLDLK
jgi:hypothetical protein